MEVPNDGVKLIDVLDSERQPQPGKSIIFHETSCPENGELRLGPRQICSIESAAKNNPNFDIFILFLSPRFIIFDSIQKEIQRLQLNYKNLFFRNNDIWRYTENSPAYQFLESGEIFESNYLPVHMSDFIRLISIWKYGAFYMDSDIIVKKSFEQLEQNFGGIEEHGEDLNSALFRLAPNGTGHLLSEILIHDFVEKFDPLGWAENGPKLVSNALKKFCKETYLSKITASNCQGFTVYPKDNFWAVGWRDADSFFDETKLDKLKEITNSSYSIHVFNHITKNIENKVDSKNLFNILAAEHCPITFENSQGYM